MQKSIFFLLYFSEGAPIGFIWWALPAILAKQGFDVTSIATISSMAAIPWTFKFFLAPIVDIISLNYFGLKKQLFIYQVLMGIILFFIPTAINSRESSNIIALLLIHGFFAATQDICIDSLAIKTIPEAELGSTNGIMQAGMLVGRSLFGGAGVYIAHAFGINILTYFLISSIWISIVFLQKTKFKLNATEKVSIKKYFKDFLNLIKDYKFWKLVAITYLAGYSYNGISTIASAVLTKKGVTPSLHGITYSIFIPLSMTFGSLFAGKLCDIKGTKKILTINLFLSIMSSLIVGIAMDYTENHYLLILSYGLFYIFIGSTTTALYSFLMKNTNKEFSALEFSIFMGVTNMCDSSSSYLTGQLVNKYSYTMTSGFIAIICLLTFIFLKNKKLES